MFLDSGVGYRNNADDKCAKMLILAGPENWTNLYAFCECNKCSVYINSLDIPPNIHLTNNSIFYNFDQPIGTILRIPGPSYFFFIVKETSV